MRCSDDRVDTIIYRQPGHIQDLFEFTWPVIISTGKYVTMDVDHVGDLNLSGGAIYLCQRPVLIEP